MNICHTYSKLNSRINNEYDSCHHYNNNNNNNNNKWQRRTDQVPIVGCHDYSYHEGKKPSWCLNTSNLNNL